MQLDSVVCLSLVTASISFIVTETKLLKPFRKWAQRKNAILGELVFCGYCFGHWVSFVLVPIYRPRLFYWWWGFDYFLTALVIAWISGFQWIAMCWLMQKAGK